MSTQSTRRALLCPEDRFTQVPNVLHELAETPREFHLMVALVSFRWHPTSPIIPSVKRLAELLKCSQRTVRRTAAELERRGLIARVERRAWDRRQMSNEYALCGPLLAAVTAIEDSRDQIAGQAWQGRRTPTSGKPYSRNHKTGTTGREGATPPITDPRRFTESQYAAYVRR